jgi:pimeloyl-ACP methyl ester carboxylesterase
VADCAEDVAAIADALGIDRFYTAGASGGAPHALACAALLGERVIGAAALAGPAPLDADGLDWFAGMAEENVAEYTAAQEGADQLVAFLEREASQLAGATGEALNDALGGLLSDVDRQTLTRGYADHLAKSTRAAMEQGIGGWFDDDIAFIRDWGFDLGAIERPVAIWHGGQDQFVPFAHGEWVAAHVSGARAHLLRDEGHLSLVVGNYGAILDDLRQNAG